MQMMDDFFLGGGELARSGQALLYASAQMKLCIQTRIFYALFPWQYNRHEARARHKFYPCLLALEGEYFQLLK